VTEVLSIANSKLLNNFVDFKKFEIKSSEKFERKMKLFLTKVLHLLYDNHNNICSMLIILNNLKCY
jgi:hypothetical protein